jgi:hypothetical protein
VPPLLTQCQDSVSAGGVASKRGYAFTLSTVAPLRPPLPANGANNLLVRPNSAALNLTIALPLSPTFVTTSLTPLVPWTQLLANIVGLSGVLSVVGVLFGVAEKRLGGRGKAPLAGGGCSVAPPAAGGGGVGSAAEEIAALQQRLIAQHAEYTQQLAALAERVRGASPLAGEGAPLVVAANNPLVRAHPAPPFSRRPALENGRPRNKLRTHPRNKFRTLKSTPSTFLPNLQQFVAAAAARECGDLAGAAVPARRWQRCQDATDVWFVAEDSGETVWEVPEGGVVVNH